MGGRAVSLAPVRGRTQQVGRHAGRERGRGARSRARARTRARSCARARALAVGQGQRGRRARAHAACEYLWTFILCYNLIVLCSYIVGILNEGIVKLRDFVPLFQS